MAQETRELRAKGPLWQPTALRTTSSAVKPAVGGEISFDIPKKGKKAKQQVDEPRPFDSSAIVSPFLDPSIVERRVKAAKQKERQH
ncbi:hypothetical protein LTR36_005688 [Oleoguttula mirabilis]|uniref:Uncharacterized protein n=1 Tax=Oleoguttula mirabilis TaxID=1507867 RepID=A0AAV9JE78_9PEZI|nr:hypothetical protein LTR36_005688 [Oleoguttula mirabilis]